MKFIEFKICDLNDVFVNMAHIVRIDDMGEEKCKVTLTVGEPFIVKYNYRKACDLLEQWAGYK